MNQTIARLHTPGTPVIVIFKETITLRGANEHFEEDGSSYQVIPQWHILTGFIVKHDETKVQFRVKQGHDSTHIQVPFDKVVVRQISKYRVQDHGEQSQGESR